MKIQNIVEQAKTLQSTTDNHIDYCIGNVVSRLSIDEMGEIVAETGNKRYIRMHQRIVDPTMRRQPWTDRDVEKAIGRLRNSIESEAMAKNR